jgi:hypothetical protein
VIETEHTVIREVVFLCYDQSTPRSGGLCSCGRNRQRRDQEVSFPVVETEHTLIREAVFL